MFPRPCRQGAAPHHLPFPHSVLGCLKISFGQEGNVLFANLKGVKILSCQRERKGRRVAGCSKGGGKGAMWNLRWQDLCGVSLLGVNKPQDDLICKTCWTCWQEQSPRSSLQRVCLLLPTAFQLPSDSVCFLGICFLVQCSSSPDRSLADEELLWAKVRRGCGHPTSPALPPGGQQQRSVTASKGLSVRNGETAVASYSHWQAGLALNPLLL